MRETDLLAFEIGVTEGQPGSVICSYNKVNGDWACENSYLLTDMLKKAWGFKGYVMSDWGGTHTTAKAALAGLDNEEPGGDPPRRLRRRFEEGRAERRSADRPARTTWCPASAHGVRLGIVDDPHRGRVVSRSRRADTARTIEEEGTVLLKDANDSFR